MKYAFYHFLLQIFFIIKSQRVEVKIQQGILLGNRELTVFEDRLYFAFYAVPYARVPVGRFRYKDPKPPKKWSKPYNARTEYRGACAQAHIVHKYGLYGNEDCLYLNIYTPYLPNNGYGYLKTVIVWIHGYAFASSFSHVYGPDFFIDNDVLFISLTHRIGVFGFMKLNDTDSNTNMGLKDIIMALKWIRKNVKKFGGDKNKITVMGSGSAATFIALLMTSSHRMLFSKAILHSGSLFSPSIFQSDHKLERNRLTKELKNVGVNSVVKATSKDIVLFSQKIYTKKEIINFQRPVVPFTPIVEKKSGISAITEQSHDIYNSMRSIDFRVPILIGFNSQASISEIIPFVHNPRFLRNLGSFFKYMVPFTNGCKFNYSSTLYRKVASKIRARYFKDGLSERSIQNFLRYTTDLHIYPIYKFIKAYLALKSNIYVYKFNYVGKFNVVKANSLAGARVILKGAAEGDEICYILKCEPLWESYVKLKNNSHNQDRIFIKRIAEMWANFAKFGDPVHNKQDIIWPPMTKNSDNVYVFSKESNLLNSKVERSMFMFWNDIYDGYYSQKHCEDFHDEL